MTKNNEIKICFISGSRSDYGIASFLLKKMKKTKNINLSFIATCMHLSAHYGNTFKEIENDGLKITKKIYLPLNTNKKNVINLIIIKFVNLHILIEQLQKELQLIQPN